MKATIQILSLIIILLGVLHISFAFPLYANTDTLWFVGAGMAIIFVGLMNIITLDTEKKRSLYITLICNLLNCLLFCVALAILNEPQVYLGIGIFAATSICFGILAKQRM
jgi:hypothetical protein